MLNNITLNANNNCGLIFGALEPGTIFNYTRTAPPSYLPGNYENETFAVSLISDMSYDVRDNKVVVPLASGNSITIC